MAIYSLACSTICHGQENRMQLKEVLATTPEVLNRHQTLSDSVLQERITQLQIVPYFGHSEATDNPRGVYKLTGCLTSMAMSSRNRSTNIRSVQTASR